MIQADAQQVIELLSRRIAQLELDNAVLQSIVSAYENAEQASKEPDTDDAQ